jgi:hypothetical protein
MEKISSELHSQGIISDESFQKIKQKEENPTFSFYWELRTILYIGVLMFSTGLGILVYQNIDTIGHQAILTFIALACGGCFYYCFKQGKPFAPKKIVHESPFFDYVLLLGALLFLTFEGYIQYQYQVFGTNYNLAAILPTFFFAFLAYRFDHVGILSMAITGFAAWLGISITPLSLFETFDYASERLIYTGEFLGITLGSIGWFLTQKEIKSHFFFTYLNFATHLLFVATLSGLFLANEYSFVFWFLWLALLVGASFFHAKKEKSFYFLLIAILYGYIGLTYGVFKLMESLHDDSMIYLGMWYFMASCGGIIYFLVNHRKIVNKLFGNA